MKQFTLTLTQEQVEQLKKAHATRDNKTETEVVQQALDLGLSQLCYRTERNKKMYAEFKAFRQMQKQ